MKIENASVAVIGLGYVGLPLAVEFGKNIPTTGFDINFERVEELKSGSDRTLESSKEEIAKATHLRFTCDLEDLKSSNVYIVTVPTPIDIYKQPDLSYIVSASNTVGQAINRGDVVIFESTVFPGATEEICIPEIERVSSLKYNVDFFVGYSPERINPGDKLHKLADIKKVTSGSTPEAAAFIDKLYQTIIKAGTHLAPTIQVAEAAKVIENTQRDVNIALVNELAIIFNRMGIDTNDVLEAAGTKWNFLPFRPGLVGGHCIGVDPYYLTHKAEAVGYHPEIILAGRRLNDGMSIYVANQLIKEMLKKRIAVSGAKALVLGLTFKENCPDLRNTRVVEVISELLDFGVTVDVCDPWADQFEAKKIYGIDLIEIPESGDYDTIILAVSHHEFVELGLEKLQALANDKHIFYDLKSVFERNASVTRL